MLCIWLSNGKTMTRFITISQSEQKKRLHGTNQKLKGKQTNYQKRGKTRVANLRLAQVLHLIGGKSLLSRKTFDAEETSV